MTMLVDRLTTPLQLIHYAWRAFEERAFEEVYVAGQKPVDAETVHGMLVPDLEAWSRV